MIIGICGKAGSGKDTIADYLCDHMGYNRDSLAAPIKRLVMDVFGLDEETVYDRVKREQPLPDWPGWTVRKLLQFIGTELMRKNIDDRIWVKSLCLRLKRSLGSYVIPDVRIPNEAQMLKETFGDAFIMIKVVRPGCDGNTVGGIQGHETEKYDIQADHVLVNDSTIEDLWKKVSIVMEMETGNCKTGK